MLVLIPYPLHLPGSLVASESVDKLRAMCYAFQNMEMVRLGILNGMSGMIGTGMTTMALIEVVKQHNVGDEGWALVRWEVYDMVSV